MYMFYVLIITHLYSNISQASDIFVQNLFVDNYSYLQTTLSTTVSANPDSISILYAFSGASLDFHVVCHCAQWQTFGLYVEMAYLYILVHFWSTNMIAVMKADEL